MIPFHLAGKQGCNIQQFYAGDSAAQPLSSWTKPSGVSHVYMLLISAGGNGNNSTQGGGSSAVTVWYGAAENVPDVLQVAVGLPGFSTASYTAIFCKGSGSGSGSFELLKANPGDVTGGGAASSENFFTTTGFFTSTAGVSGGTGAPTASSSTFLSAGCGNAASSATANYGYKTSGAGYFQLQPVIVGIGSTDNNLIGGIGCGGDVSGGKGGNGFALIASW